MQMGLNVLLWKNKMMCIWMTEQEAEVYATSSNIPSAFLELKYLPWTIIQLLCEGWSKYGKKRESIVICSGMKRLA